MLVCFYHSAGYYCCQFLAFSFFVPNLAILLINLIHSVTMKNIFYTIFCSEARKELLIATQATYNQQIQHFQIVVLFGYC